MMTRACLVLLAGALLGGCELASAPQPSILDVEPSEWVANGQSVELRLHVDALLPGAMDYGSRSVSSDDLAEVVQVWIGERRAVVQRSEPGGILVVTVPADLAAGEHELRLVLSDGREARRAQGLVVKSATETSVPIEPPTGPVELSDGGTPAPDAGTVDQELPPDGGTRQERHGLSGFRFDPIEEATRNEPFELVLSAEGSEAASFQGSVTLTVSKGTISPTTAGPFENGVLRVTVTVDHPGGKIVITAEDEHGNVGSTSEFRVRPN